MAMFSGAGLFHLKYAVFFERGVDRQVSFPRFEQEERQTKVRRISQKTALPERVSLPYVGAVSMSFDKSYYSPDRSE